MATETRSSAAERLDEIVAWADNRRRHIESDERFYGPRASMFSNSVLSAIQIALTTEHTALCAVLSMAEFKFQPATPCSGRAPQAAGDSSKGGAS